MIYKTKQKLLNIILLLFPLAIFSQTPRVVVYHLYNGDSLVKNYSKSFKAITAVDMSDSIVAVADSGFVKLYETEGGYILNTIDELSDPDLRLAKGFKEYKINLKKTEIITLSISSQSKYLLIAYQYGFTSLYKLSDVRYSESALIAAANKNIDSRFLNQTASYINVRMFYPDSISKETTVDFSTKKKAGKILAWLHIKLNVIKKVNAPIKISPNDRYYSAIDYEGCLWLSDSIGNKNTYYCSDKTIADCQFISNDTIGVIMDGRFTFQEMVKMPNQGLMPFDSKLPLENIKSFKYATKSRTYYFQQADKIAVYKFVNQQWVPIQSIPLSPKFHHFFCSPNGRALAIWED